MYKFRDQLVTQLRHHRKACGFSQQDVANKLAIGQRTYQRLETGETTPSLDQLFQLSKILEFSLNTLFSPEKTILAMPEIKIIEKNEEFYFLNHPLVVNSKILELAQIDFSQDVEAITKHPLFCDSPYFIAATTIENTHINEALRKRLELKNGIIQTSHGTDKIREQGALWAYLISTNHKYIEEKRTKIFPVGPVELVIRRIFIQKNSQYLMLSVNEIL